MNDQEEDTHCNILHCHFACIEATLLSPMDTVPGTIRAGIGFVCSSGISCSYVFLYHMFSFITMYAELLKMEE